MHGKKLHPSTFVKYLGVFIDENLNWEKHTDFVCDKLKQANGALCKLRHYVSPSILVSLYFALFHSHMSYACQVWGQNSSYKTQRVLNLQKRAMRIITFSDFNSHSAPLFLDLKILSFFDYVKMCNIIFLHKLINNKLPLTVLNNFIITFNACNRPNDRANPGSIRLLRVRTVTFGNNSIQYQSIISWNLLQQFLEVNMSTLSLGHLKYLVKFYFFSSYSSFNI